MAFAIKAEIRDPRAKAFSFTAQKTMYGGKQIAKGDTIFLFASENEGGHGPIARGIVTSAEAVAKKRGHSASKTRVNALIARQTPRVNIALRRTALAKRPLGRGELKRFADWSDGRRLKPSSISNSIVRRPTGVVGISEKVAAYLDSLLLGGGPCGPRPAAR